MSQGLSVAIVTMKAYPRFSCPQRILTTICKQGARTMCKNSILYNTIISYLSDISTCTVVVSYGSLAEKNKKGNVCYPTSHLPNEEKQKHRSSYSDTSLPTPYTRIQNSPSPLVSNLWCHLRGSCDSQTRCSCPARALQSQTRVPSTAGTKHCAAC